MKTIIAIFISFSFSVAAFNASAQSVTATGTTLDSAEAVIAQKAKEINASEYKITSARMGNTSHHECRTVQITAQGTHYVIC